MRALPSSTRSETPRAKLKEKIDQAQRIEDSAAPDLSGFYLFLSFDLVDATRYKEQDPENWPFVISRFYELITDSADKHLQPVHLWKLVGDEVLLFKRIAGTEVLARSVRAAHRILQDTVTRLHREFADANPLLSVKGTAWCARVDHVPPQDLGGAQRQFERQQYRNIVIPQLGDSRGGEFAQLDFLGPDVDAGFRISKFVTRRRLVVSADLAYLLYRDRSNLEPIEHQLKVVSYEPLKGVWGGAPVPYHLVRSGLARSWAFVRV